MGAMSRRKGKNGELEIAKLLREYGFSARRGVQYSGSPDSPDVVCEEIPMHLEIKRTEKLNIYNAMEQATNDAKPGRMPIVAHRRNRGDWLFIARASDVLTILREKRNIETNQNNDPESNHPDWR